MMLEIESISVNEAKQWLASRECYLTFTDFAFAIAVYNLEDDKRHGIIAMLADGKECKLGHLYTDGAALVGSILYGAAWRAAKALGYKTITL